MFYLSLKSVHLLATILWIGSLFLISFVTSSNTMNTAQMRSAVRVTDAAIGVAWLTGIVLVVMGGWYLSSWWQLKITFVIAISAIHTVVHRRWKNAEAEGATTNRAIPYFVLLLVLIVILLVVFKRPI